MADEKRDIKDTTEKKVLLKITNLKQYFPLKQKGLYVKANDGIDVKIYEGETFGLVGESGCGKSTFGRTILELYPQTDGRTMYYGRSLDEFAPEYMSHTIENLPALRKKWIRLRQKEKEAQAEFDKASASEQHAKNEALRQAKRDADAAFYDIASIFGGFITVEDCQHIQDAFKSARDHSAELRKLLDERRVNENKLADAKYNLEKKGKGQKKIDSINAKIEEIDGKKIVNAFQFGPALVVDGEPVDDAYIMDRGHSPASAEPDINNPRMCIAQIDDLHYFVLTCWWHGMNVAQLRDLVLSITPCKTLYVLDGGNSSQIVYLGTQVNMVPGQNDRTISDTICFLSALPDEEN